MNKKIKVYVTSDGTWECLKGVHKSKQGAHKALLGDKFDEDLSEKQLDELLRDTPYYIEERELED